jgi:hypothetical protein
MFKAAQHKNLLDSSREGEKTEPNGSKYSPVLSVPTVHFVNAIPKYLKFFMCSSPGCEFLLHFVSVKWSHACTYFS